LRLGVEIFLTGQQDDFFFSWSLSVFVVKHAT